MGHTSQHGLLCEMMEIAFARKMQEVVLWDTCAAWLHYSYRFALKSYGRASNCSGAAPATYLGPQKGFKHGRIVQCK